MCALIEKCRMKNSEEQKLDSHLFSDALRLWFSGEYNWVCQPVDYSDSPMVGTDIRKYLYDFDL